MDLGNVQWATNLKHSFTIGQDQLGQHNVEVLFQPAPQARGIRLGQHAASQGSILA